VHEIGKCFDVAQDPCAAMALLVGVDAVIAPAGRVAEAQAGDFEEWRRRWGAWNPYLVQFHEHDAADGAPSPAGLARWPDADRPFVQCVVEAVRGIRFELPPDTPSLRLWYPFHVQGAC
jgi:hypothetical protein